MIQSETDRTKIKQLENRKREHTKQIEILQDSTSGQIEPKDIIKSKDKLTKLKHNGKAIEDSLGILQTQT